MHSQQTIDYKSLCENATSAQKQLAKANGIDIDEICSFGSNINEAIAANESNVNINPIKIPDRLTVSSKGDITASNNITPVAVSGTKSSVDNPKVLRPFGYDLLAGDPSTFAPILNIPVDPNYLLGPGDSVNILIYGKANQNITIEINRDGIINIPEIGPLSVAGLTFIELKKLIETRISEQMIGVNTSITLGNLRSMQIFVLGESFKPGAYTISSLSTVTHALLASGGVSDIGSLRNIQVKREGELINTIDLYDLLLKGDRKNDIRLNQGDVVFIPTAKNLVSISGQVIRPAIYEIKENTTLGNVINLAGGLSPKAYPRSATLERITDDGFVTSVNLDLKSVESLSIKIKAGDHIKINAIKNIKKDIVRLSGEVYFPREFGWTQGMKVLDILNEVSEFPPRFDPNFAVIIRKSMPDLQTQVIRLDLNLIKDNPFSAANIDLQPMDDIKIFSLDSDRALFISQAVSQIINQTEYPNLPRIVSISGPLKSPGSYPLYKDMRISDLFEFSGGFNAGFINFNYSFVSRVSDKDGKKKVIKFDLKSALSKDIEHDMKLMPNDRVYLFALNEDPALQISELLMELNTQRGPSEPAQVVYIGGSIKYPGTYPIPTSGISVIDLINASGGFIEKSYMVEAELSRLDFSNQDKVDVINKKLNLDNEKSTDNKTLLEPYDNINIRTIPDFSDRKFVGLYGEFKFPGRYVIHSNETLLSVIDRAGGFTDRADINASIFTRERLRIAEQEQITELKARLSDEVANQQLEAVNSGINIASEQIEIQNDAISQLDKSNPIGRLVIPLENMLNKSVQDIDLYDKDTLYIPSKRNEVTIIGEVYRPSSHLYEKYLSIDDYIERSGGINDQADFKNIYVVRANGEVIVPSNISWLSPKKEGFYQVILLLYL